MTNLILELFNENGEPSLINISNALAIDPSEADDRENPAIDVWFDKEKSIKCYGISFEDLKELICQPYDAEFIK